MGTDPTKQTANVYFRARKEAAKCDERLYSREGAAELLGISVSTLADYELGNTKVVPVDKVMLMADLFKSPELKAQYCKHECPIGKTMPLATQITGIEGIALRLIREFDADKIREIEKNLIDIAADGVISDDEKPKLEEILKRIDDLALAINELKLAGEKVLKG